MQPESQMSAGGSTSVGRSGPHGEDEPRRGIRRVVADEAQPHEKRRGQEAQRDQI